uniref:Uncharacterized protein n=1 Tax=Trieres chinensis TaxID=1514140 RepID=A0A7S1ZBF9_TRICV
MPVRCHRKYSCRMFVLPLKVCPFWDNCHCVSLSSEIGFILQLLTWLLRCVLQCLLLLQFFLLSLQNTFARPLSCFLSHFFPSVFPSFSFLSELCLNFFKLFIRLFHEAFVSHQLVHLFFSFQVGQLHTLPLVPVVENS